MPKALTSYDILKSMIIKKQSNKDIQYYKQHFRDEISSTRRYACIKTFDDLLDCLERLDILSEYNVEPLRKIFRDNVNYEIYMLLEKYVPPQEPYELLNCYALQRFEESKVTKAELKSEQLKSEGKSTIVFEFTQEKRDQIYKLIAQDIGRDWRSLGRELLVRAGDLDNLDSKYPYDLRSKVHEVFNIFEDDPRHNPREHFYIICEALDGCKRKDIRRDVQKIMRNN